MKPATRRTPCVKAAGLRPSRRLQQAVPAAAAALAPEGE